MIAPRGTIVPSEKAKTSTEDLVASIIPIDKINKCNSCDLAGYGAIFHFRKPYKVKITLCFKCLMKRAWRNRNKSLGQRYVHGDPSKAMPNER